MKRFFQLLVLILIIACKKETSEESFPAKSNTNLEYFGFTLIDVSWDDPSDEEIKTNYIDEVAAFTNIADILVYDPMENIVDRLNVFEANGVQAFLHLNEIFFELKSEGGEKSGYIYGLRDDYQSRWDDFISTNDLLANQSKIKCFYIGEEPSWNGITAEEFELACDYAKETIPAVKIMNIEAYPDVDNIFTPTSVDLVGFDHYFLKDPSINMDFLSEFNTVKSKLKAHQNIMLIMDAHWIEEIHGVYGINKLDMAGIARDYYEFANGDISIVGIIGYFWPSGFDLYNSVGARHLPTAVMEEYKSIGKAITGK